MSKYCNNKKIKTKNEKPKKEYKLNEEEELKIKNIALKIEDEKLQKNFIELMRKDMKYRLEKLDNGGSECPICKCIHDRKGICIFCKNKLKAQF